MPEVVMYSSVFCPYCVAAKMWFKKNNIKFKNKEIFLLFGNKVPTPTYAEMKKVSGGKTTIPQIVVDGKYFGDEEKLIALSDEEANKIFGI